MNVIANARSSAAARHIQSAPLIRASSLFTDNELAQARFFANLPRTAGAVKNYLAPYAKRGTLDETLAKLLRTAQATVNANVARDLRAHNRSMH